MRLGILGAGSWGTALALTALRAGHDARLWGRDGAQMAELAASRLCRALGDGVRLPPGIEPTADLASCADLSLLLVAVPAQATRGLLRLLNQYGGTLLLCAKGIERGTGLRVSQIAEECCPAASVGVLSGPSFAGEVAGGLPTALVCGHGDAATARSLARDLASPAFRIYPNDDVIGVEIGGALKNVIAIAAGAVMGLGLGENARAAVITRGLAELTRLGVALGGRAETLGGLAGIGDLVLTATSQTSRNTRFGRDLASGASAEELRSSGRRLSEGAWTAEAALALAARHGVELPITQAVADVLEGRCALGEAVDRLLARPIKEAE